LYALSTVLILAAEEEAEEGNIALVLPETYELIAGIIAFAIVFFFVWKWAFPAINRSLENRQQAISGQLKEAEAAKVEAQSLLDDYRAQLADAKGEANRIVEEARAQAEAVRSEVVSRSESEAEEIVAKARADAASEKARALQEARREVAGLSIDLAEKVVGESLDREAQQGLIERYLADLERMA
jgi:F-type H+-transporting ATPase subunit b